MLNPYVLSGVCIPDFCHTQNAYTQSLGRFPKLAGDVEEEENKGDQERRPPNAQSDKRALESK